MVRQVLLILCLGAAVGEICGVGDGICLEAIMRRRFANKKWQANRTVTYDLQQHLLELLLTAPSALNTQPGRLVVVDTEESKRRLAEAMDGPNPHHVLESSFSVVFAADPEPSLPADAPRFFAQVLRDVSLAQACSDQAWAEKQVMLQAAYFLLAATEHGLATNPMEGFKSKAAVREAVGLPDNYGVAVVVSVGYAQQEVAQASRRYVGRPVLPVRLRKRCVEASICPVFLILFAGKAIKESVSTRTCKHHSVLVASTSYMNLIPLQRDGDVFSLRVEFFQAAVALKQRVWSQFVLPKVKSFHQMLMLCGDTTMQLRPLGPSGPVVHCIQSGAEMAKMFRDNPNKLLRFNPLDVQHLPGPLGKFMSLDDSLMQVVDGIAGTYSDFDLVLAICVLRCFPIGPDREQLKSHIVTFGKRFSDQKVLDRMYKDLRKHFETFSMEGGEKSKNLFDVIQRTIVAVLLSEMFGCSLPDDVMLDVTPARLQELANKVFGALPNGPAAKDWKMLKRVVDHMTAEAVEGSMAWHLRDTYEGKPKEKEGTIRSNMLVLLLIGAQSMANGAYWLTLCLQDPDRLSRLRRGDGKLADVLVEEMRRHPPSAPILMPYKVISAFTDNGMDFRERDIVVISPP
ncbi:nfsB, partial [Symbiodinium necroappetens]